MFGNYPTNDDWIFIRQVEAFSHGIFKLSSELDPSFISQGFIGLIWGKIFGINFVSLQVLTFFFTILGLVGVVLILRLFKTPKIVQILASILYLFNPLIFTSAFTFMTDNYFLTFMIWSAYFYLKYYQDLKLKNVLFGSIFVCLATFTRQIGVIIGITFILTILLDAVKDRKISIDKKQISAILLTLLSVGISLLVTFIWPRFGSNRVFILPEHLVERVQYLLLSLHYLPFFMFPLLLGLPIKIDKNWRLLIAFLIGGIYTSKFLYSYDFFPVGNVLYLEGLYSKSDFRSNFSLFDNVYFKVFLSLLISYSFVKTFHFFTTRKFTFPDVSTVFLTLLACVNFIALLISSDFYDRYLLPIFVCILLLFLKHFYSYIRITKLVIFGLFLFIFITVTLQWEFSSQNNLKWRQVSALSQKTGLVTQISLNDTYINYIVSKEKNDYTGLVERRASFEPLCFVQSYTVDSNSAILEYAQEFEDYLGSTILKKEKTFASKKKSDVPRAKNNLDVLIYNQKYPSLLFNLVGKDAYVASWCEEDL